MRVAGRWPATLILLAGCATSGPRSEPPSPESMAADTAAISRLARDLSADSMLGRGAWTPENARAARLLAMELERLGARPLFGDRLLVPLIAAQPSGDTAYNVAGVLPGRRGRTEGELVGLTSHLDHLGVGPPNETGDSIYNGFLDAALPMAMVLDVARRYSLSPGDRPLVVLFFNLEEEGLLGSSAMVRRPDAAPLLERLRLLIGVDAGSPVGEALEWQLMGGLPEHPGARLADSIARSRGWTTTATPPRPISDVFHFAEAGVPILFPIPGPSWRGYTAAERDRAMARFDHYHQPDDEWHADFPLVGTAHYADWLWEIIRAASDADWPWPPR